MLPKINNTEFSSNQILLEDDFLIVVNKPSGWVINRSETWSKPTVQDLVESHMNIPSVKSSESSDFLKRAGIVHRLDKETSGALLVAKTEECFVELQKQFASRQVQKEYVALVYGKFPEEKIQVNAPLKRNPRNRMKYAVVSDGKAALTEFKLIKHLLWDGEVLSIVNAWPKTGRTHQIRVHSASLNHPVVGDSLYLGKKRMFKSRSAFNRLMLHAHKITFIHPSTKESLEIEAPLPDEFRILL